MLRCYSYRFNPENEQMSSFSPEACGPFCNKETAFADISKQTMQTEMTSDLTVPDENNL